MREPKKNVYKPSSINASCPFGDVIRLYNTLLSGKKGSGANIYTWNDFINGQCNVIKAEAIISREKTTSGTELIHISVGDYEVYQFWNNPNKPVNSKPKHTGGKKPYLLVSVTKMNELRNTINNAEELIGYLVCLGNNIEWNTGKLIHTRNKKPLKYIDLSRVLKCGKKKLDRIIRELKSNSLLINNSDGYFISTKLIRKGKTVK